MDKQKLTGTFQICGKIVDSKVCIAPPNHESEEHDWCTFLIAMEEQNVRQ